MIELRLQLQHLEHIVGGALANPGFSGDARAYTAFDGRLRYERLVELTPLVPACPGLIEFSEQSLAVRRLYAEVMQSSALIASGKFEFADFCFFGVSALPVDIDSSVFLIGEPFGFSIEYARWYITASKRHDSLESLTWSTDQQEALLTLRSKHFVQLDEACIILSHPGQYIYGHWILDMTPRLLLLQQRGFDPEIPIMLNELPPWAGFFFAAFGLDIARVRSLPCGITRIGSAVMPSTSKSGFRLGAPLLADSWRHLKGFVEDAGLSSPDLKGLPRPAKIYVSRQNWPDKRRAIRNISEVERLAVELGYQVIHPEIYSVAQQAAVFRHARAIVGEDGSALHNIIFADAGCVLGVIGVPERVNLWHLGICEALGHRAAYTQAYFDDAGQRVVRFAEIREMMSAIEAQITP
jgi:capsular polysaccharide biosynthesis protein